MRTPKQSNLPTPRFLSVPEVGKICGVSRNTVYNWVKKGVLDAYQTPGRTNLIRPGDLQIFMRENGMFVPDILIQIAEEDASRVGFVPKSELHPKPALPVVLFVDGEDKDRSVAERALRDLAEVHVAQTGYEGMHILTMQEKISLAFVNLSLEGMSGEDTIKQIHTLRPELPVVAICPNDDTQPTPELNVVGQVVKPLRLGNIRDALNVASKVQS